MRIVYLTHSLLSCWNHGNAHFLRGVLRELVARGHIVQTLEPENGWSLTNLLREHGPAALTGFGAAFPELQPLTYATDDDVIPVVESADLVIVHEWTDPALVRTIGELRRRESFTLLFHDTHHRAVSAPDTMQAFDLTHYDGVLAFGQTVADVYRAQGWHDRVFTWHEAADTRLFRPPAKATARYGVVWIGNWGDDERSAELAGFLLRPTATLGIPLDIYGVRYPDAALQLLSASGGAYRGWLPNARVPDVFSRHLATVHVPRRYYATVLPGVPTIRVFEALACGIPLISAPWEDTEGLFRPGRDFLVARSEREMTAHLKAILNEPALRQSLAAAGLETILARHTCAHRVDELLRIVGGLRPVERRVA